MSAWLADPQVGYLAAAVVATSGGALTLTRAVRPIGRASLAVAIVSLAVACFFGLRAQLRLDRFTRRPAEVGAQESEARRTALAQTVTEELSELRQAAERAHDVPTDPRQKVAALQHDIHDTEHRAIAVLRGDTLVAWAGTLHADLAQLGAESGVVGSPFGLTLYVSDTRGREHVIATSLLYAAVPADRITRGLSQRMPSDEVTEGFVFTPPGETALAGDLTLTDGGRVLFHARPILPSTGEVRLRLLERARVRVGIALLLGMVAFLVAVARRDGGALTIGGGTLVVLACIALIPLSEFSTRSRMFDPSVYYLPVGLAFTASAAALSLTAATMLLLALLAVRRIGGRVPRALAVGIAALSVVIGPFAVRALSRGIAPPADGADGALWVIWNIPLCLIATTVLVIANWAGRRSLAAGRGVPIMTGPAIAALAAILAPLVWEAPGQWPQWYSAVWALAVASIVLARPSRRALRACAMVAALAATTVVWGSASRGRVALAERDVRGLDGSDAYALRLAGRLARDMQGDELPASPQMLLERFVSSDLASAGYPVALLSWSHDSVVASFGSAPFDVAFDTVAMTAMAAQRAGHRVDASLRAGAYRLQVIAVPMKGGASTIVVAPRTRLIGTDAYARWFGISTPASNEPPYMVQVINDALPQRADFRWRREDTEIHGDWPVEGLAGPARAHVEVDLRGLDSLIPRGGLLVIIDLIVVSLVWLLGALADGRVNRWLRMRRRQIRSYRARLSVALFLFFLVPAAVFAIWSWRQLSDDAQSARRLLVSETMRAFAWDPAQPRNLQAEARRLDTKLLLYRSGVLVAASDSLFADFAPMGTLMRPDVALDLNVADEYSATRPERLDGALGMLGYRVLPRTYGSFVIAAPARVDDFLLDRRRRDLGVLVLFATALGAAAALWLSAIAARQLARPIGALREAARAIARGDTAPPLPRNAVGEFVPVFTAFRAMARDLGESRAALEEARRRTDAVLRTVASGVIAVDERACVILSNPRTESLLGALPREGESIGADDVGERVRAFLGGRHEATGFELERGARTLRGQLTRLESGGAVLTLDDVTELARAQRVLAWGEMARQVAHEIKNPLTPIRLGVQHLLRARGRDNFDAVLEQNVSRILTEIDRLDEIARSFSRYGGAPEQRAPAEPTDVTAIVRDVVALEKLGEGSIAWSVDVSGEVPHALARGDELREVLLNLFENARHAGASTVTAIVQRVAGGSGSHVEVAITDDGAGIEADVLPRIFEPHFSTRTSGSGLGLAITRRLIEQWGGEVSIESEVGRGTTVHVLLVPA